MRKLIEREAANAVRELLAGFPSEKNSVSFMIQSARGEGAAAMCITDNPEKYILQLSAMRIDSSGLAHIKTCCLVRGSERKIRCWLRRKKKEAEIADKLIWMMDG